MHVKQKNRAIVNFKLTTEIDILSLSIRGNIMALCIIFFLGLLSTDESPNDFDKNH